MVIAYCGRYHTLAINTSGQLYSCGQNNYGQCGITSTDNTIETWRYIRGSFDGAAGDKVSAGMYHSILFAGNEIYTFGRNYAGALARNNFVDSHDTYLKIDGGPWAEMIPMQGSSYGTILIK